MRTFLAAVAVLLAVGCSTEAGEMAQVVRGVPVAALDSSCEQGRTACPSLKESQASKSWLSFRERECPMCVSESHALGSRGHVSKRIRESTESIGRLAIGGTMSFVSLIDTINKLPHERTFVCTKCGQAGTASILSIYSDCQRCSTRHKLRGYGAMGDEVEDIIDAVLTWMGSGATLDAVMRRKREIEESE
jgi:hypothetical protein